MTGRSKTLCITCGIQVEETTQLNRLPNGQICPTCRERVLDSIPAPLPRGPEIVERSERMSLFDGMIERGEGEWPPAERRF
jgi:DNA-directed RNA polymerase subunit RPC12/RpoP